MVRPSWFVGEPVRTVLRLPFSAAYNEVFLHLPTSHTYQLPGNKTKEGKKENAKRVFPLIPKIQFHD